MENEENLYDTLTGEYIEEEESLLKTVGVVCLFLDVAYRTLGIIVKSYVRAVRIMRERYPNVFTQQRINTMESAFRIEDDINPNMETISEVRLEMSPEYLKRYYDETTEEYVEVDPSNRLYDIMDDVFGAIKQILLETYRLGNVDVIAEHVEITIDDLNNANEGYIGTFLLEFRANTDNDAVQRDPENMYTEEEKKLRRDIEDLPIDELADYTVRFVRRLQQRFLEENLSEEHIQFIMFVDDFFTG